MAIRYRALLATLLATVTFDAAATHFAIRGGIDAFYGAPLARGVYDPWLICAPPYGCRDPWQARMEVERERRMHELRERATQSAPRLSPGEGPWGQQRYVPPATPEANIQPAYRGAGKLRPEYEKALQPIGQPPTESLK